jgi:hypothetical protein
MLGVNAHNMYNEFQSTFKTSPFFTTLSPVSPLPPSILLQGGIGANFARPETIYIHGNRGGEVGIYIIDKVMENKWKT